jgi:hypothetical protein
VAASSARADVPDSATDRPAEASRSLDAGPVAALTTTVAPPLRIEPHPAPPTVAAASSSPASAAASASSTPDATDIEGVLGHYRRAFSALDANAARAIWPGLDVRTLTRAFNQLAEQQLEFQTCDVAVDRDRATAACSGRARYVPKVGSRSARDERRQWLFNLRKMQDGWRIESVASK